MTTPSHPPAEPPSNSADDLVLAPDVDPTATARPASDDATAGTPDISRLGAAIRERAAVRSIATTGLLVLALFYTLYFAREFVRPIVFAVLLSFLFSPVVRALKRARIPEPLGAAVVILALLGALGGGAYALREPAQRWAARAPETMAGIGEKLRELRKPVESVARTAEQVEQAAAGGEAPSAGAPEVIVREPGLGERVFGTTQAFVIHALETLVLLFFLLAGGDVFLQKLIKVLPHFQDKRKAVQIARETEASVSTYLFTVAMINVGEGVVVAVAMWLLGMPNPALWGALAVLLEFIPYLGPAMMIAVLSLVALVTHDDVWRAVLAPAIFLAINIVQANFFTPLVLGRRLTLNPVAILVGLFFWWWLWGIPGAFIAVPLLATFKIFCDHIVTLAPIGEFLGK
jgi:predicted PurR-regulated permease PerM